MGYRVVWNELANKDYETTQSNGKISVIRGGLTAGAVVLLLATIVLLVQGSFATLGIVYAAAAIGLVILFSFGVSRYRHVLEL